jgi:hypothetical protein
MSDVHRLVFAATNGIGPWPCHGCDEPVLITRLIVHHLDDDHRNNDSTNLVAMHRSCHNRLHRTGRKLSIEAIRKLADPKRGVPLTDEHKRKIVETMSGRPWSAARRAAHDRKVKS